MPLTSTDRRFVNMVDRLKGYVLGVAGAVLLYLLYTPTSQIHVATAVIALALCWLLWLTQRLLNLLTMLDLELTKATDALKRTLPTQSPHG